MTIRKNSAAIKNMQIDLKSFDKMYINKLKIVVGKIRKKM